MHPSTSLPLWRRLLSLLSPSPPSSSSSAAIYPGEYPSRKAHLSRPPSPLLPSSRLLPIALARNVKAFYGFFFLRAPFPEKSQRSSRQRAATKPCLHARYLIAVVRRHLPSEKSAKKDFPLRCKDANKGFLRETLSRHICIFRIKLIFIFSRPRIIMAHELTSL